MKALPRRGVTTLELLAIVVLAGLVASLFWIQKSDADSRQMDSARKQSMNAIAYYLEGTYYPLHHGYPAVLDAASTKGLSSEYLTDPHGHTINQPSGDYVYLPTGCQDGVCSAYKLTATLQKEAPFTKTSVVR
ncbi:MAG TPA: hypothetical protein VLF60_00120 [Candidatus Saccharimonadales bacterium]|nr:hypothetical protein [Candidatus Saccharimonadales bacterium]